MRSILICSMLASATLVLSACNQAKSPQDVQADVSKAVSEAAQSSAKADADRQQAEAQAADQLAKDQAAAAQKAADSSVTAVTDAAVTDAEGQNKIALAKCEALEGDAQKQCKDAANAHLAAVKDRAKEAKKGPITPTG